MIRNFIPKCPGCGEGLTAVESYGLSFDLATYVFCRRKCFNNLDDEKIKNALMSSYYSTDISVIDDHRYVRLIPVMYVW